MLKVSTRGKRLVGFAAGLSMLILSIVPAYAASDDTTVYVTKTGSNYHYDGCSELEGGSIKTNLKTATSMGYDPCPKCVSGSSETVENPSKSDNDSETVVAVIGDSDTDSSANTEEENKSKDADSKNDTKSDDSSSSKSDTKTDSKSDSNTDSKTDSKTNSSTTSKTDSKTSTKTSKTSTSNSTTNSKGEKILMTEKQRRAKFKSTTNPKIGTAPTTTQPPHAISGAFMYGDFATFNNYASKNGYGGKLIYLLGTITDIQKVTEGSNYYGLAIMVNDCDGYQWYLRFNCAKDKFDMMKNQLNGKSAYLYGTYAGYSGVTNRPMMDVTTAAEVGGLNLDLVALYHQ